MSDTTQISWPLANYYRKRGRAGRKFCGYLLLIFAFTLCNIGQVAVAQTESNSESQIDGNGPSQSDSNSGTSSLAAPADPVKRVNAHIELRERDYLLNSAGLKAFYEWFDAGRGKLYKSTGLKLGGFHSTLFQGANKSFPDQDREAIATISALYGTWDVLEKGDPSAGQISFGVEARWGYGDILTPSELGSIGIGSATGTTDPYGATTPTFVLRELFWRWGPAAERFNYRIGRITPDRLFTSSENLDPVRMFFPVGSQGSPSVGFPDSGLGFAVGLYPTDRFRLGVVVADANGDRYNWGDIGEGNFFKAIEFQTKLFPITEKAPFSSVALWHTDGTDDPENAKDSSTGEDGWGFFVKLEQELSTSGKNIGMIRYGHSYDGAAAYKEQASIRYIRLDPPDPFNVKDDRFGIAASWVDPIVNPDDRTEWGFDTFYRFNLLERIEATLGYQVIFQPTFNSDNDSVQIFSFRISQFF